MYEVILFDLDGTLTDPLFGITKSVQYALHKMGIEEEDIYKLTPFIGPPLVPSFQEFYHLTEVEAKQALGHYRERFSQVGWLENKVYEGIPEMLQELTQLGKKLIVATSKPTEFAEKILEHFNLRQYFTAVIGSQLDGARVEKTEVIEFALRQCEEYDSCQIIMVGDRKYDVIGARQNGIPVVAVRYGYGNNEEFRVYVPDIIVETVAELRDVLVRTK